MTTAASPHLHRMVNDWSAAAQGWRLWEPHIVSFLSPVTRRMIDAAGLKPGHVVLDVGCGFGEPALSAAGSVGPAGRVLALDPVEPMLAVARQRAGSVGAENVEFRLGTEEQVAESDGPFDAAVARFSVIFAEQPVESMRRIRARLRPGARLSLSAWTPIENCSGFLAINMAIRRHADVPPIDPDRPGQFHLSQPGRLRQALLDAGYRDAQVETVRLSQVVRDGAEYWRMASEMGGPLKAVLAGLTPEKREAIGVEVAAAAEKFRTDGVLRIPAVAQVGWGTA